MSGICKYTYNIFLYTYILVLYTYVNTMFLFMHTYNILFSYVAAKCFKIELTTIMNNLKYFIQIKLGKI